MLLLLSKTANRLILLDSRPPLTGGNWVTINGARIYIVNNKAIAGPQHLVGKSIDEIANHGAAPTENLRPGFTPVERDAAGNYLGDNPEHGERLKALGIEPGLRKVQLANDPDADKQVVGIDSKGRPVNKYAAGHAENSTLATHARVRELRQQLPAIRAKLETDPTEEGAALRLINNTGLRIGGEKDTKADVQAYGATTLNDSHVQTDGGKTSLVFVGKKGVDQNHEIENPQVAADLRQRAAKGGKIFNTTDAKVRERWKSLAGDKFKVKDLRTVAGTEAAIKAVNSMPAPSTVSELASAKMAVGEAAAKKLGNTATIALKSYVDPTVFKSWESKVSNLEQAGLIKSAADAKGLTADSAAIPWIKKHGANYRADFTSRLKSSLGKKTLKAADPKQFQLRR